MRAVASKSAGVETDIISFTPSVPCSFVLTFPKTASFVICGVLTFGALFFVAVAFFPLFVEFEFFFFEADLPLDLLLVALVLVAVA